MNYHDLPLSEAEISRMPIPTSEKIKLRLAMYRVDRAREQFRRRTSGFTEPRTFRFPDGYSKAEHDAAMDRILADIERSK